MSKKKNKGGRKKQRAELPEAAELMRSRVAVGAKSASATRAVEDPRAFELHGVDNAFSVRAFEEGMALRILELSDERVVFDLTGVDAPLANALRRIMIAEVPTMAIDKVNLYQNTSIIQDEVLAHRLGLIPIKVDPRLFGYVADDGGEHNPHNTLAFTLTVRCEQREGVDENAPEEERYINSRVTSKDLVWVPQGQQAELFKDNPVRPVHDDILIAKLRPGQSIEAELLVEKGTGKMHAKWSPVCTATYRLMPEIVLQKPVKGKMADELVLKCPQNVFDIEDLGGSSGRQAVVKNPRDCSMCRECIRDPAWQEFVSLRRIKNHFIFQVESVGIYTARECFTEALKVLKAKCAVVKDSLHSS